MVTEITTLHIRDAVSKTFHITPEEIVLHVDTNNIPIKVPETYRPLLLLMVEIAEKNADEIMVVKEYNVHGERELLGDKAQKIWEEVLTA